MQSHLFEKTKYRDLPSHVSHQRWMGFDTSTRHRLRRSLIVQTPSSLLIHSHLLLHSELCTANLVASYKIIIVQKELLREQYINIHLLSHLSTHCYLPCLCCNPPPPHHPHPRLSRYFPCLVANEIRLKQDAFLREHVKSPRH